MVGPIPAVKVASARGVRLRLANGRELIDGMSSWWAAIHGYNHPALNAAAAEQLEQMSHVMFGGLTHAPAIRLGRQLLSVAPRSMETIFFADSGSVSVEVAMKMAIQFWQASGQPNKRKLLTIRNGYHGDTLGAMSVCDPVNGMHHLFQGVLPQQLFADAPACRFGQPCGQSDLESLHSQIASHHGELAAVIIEPIVQGAGGMRFYSAEYLHHVRRLCDEFQVLLILDEIATGFGRTGKYFACEHANIEPDILCVGKALTGGYMTLAATLTTRRIADVISDGGRGKFMHGPTFMANPLACAVAAANLEILSRGEWRSQVERIEEHLTNGLAPAKKLTAVRDVRVLGGIGVLEFYQPLNLRQVQPRFVELGVWLRPFGRLMYTMPPYVIDTADLTDITAAMLQVAGEAV